MSHATTDLRQESCTYTDRGTNMYNITVSCTGIQTTAGFLYVILPDLLNHINNPDCDQSWYSQDHRLLADPSDPQKLMDPVISVSSDRLVTSLCVNLIHEIICHFNGLKYETMFRALNDICDSIQSPESHQWWWTSVLIFIVLLLLICLILLRKRIFRCFQSVSHRNDSQNRDPESGVQMKLRSDESDSPNQSESEQMNGSVSRG